MSWAAIVSGKARHNPVSPSVIVHDIVQDAPRPSASPFDVSTSPQATLSVPNPPHLLNSSATRFSNPPPPTPPPLSPRSPRPAPTSPSQTTQTIHSVKSPCTPSSGPIPNAASDPRFTNGTEMLHSPNSHSQQRPRTNIHHKHKIHHKKHRHQQHPNSPQPKQHPNQSSPKPHHCSQPLSQKQKMYSNSMWDDPRIIANYRLWTQHISSFMAQPVPFFHFFVMNPQFRQTVFDAGLTFHPETDPANPVLINLNSDRFGMAERISALYPPTPIESRTPPGSNTPTSTPLPSQQLSPSTEFSHPLQPPPLLHPLPFLNPNMAAVFEASNAANLPLPTADSPLPLDSMPRAVLGMEGAENVPVQEFQPFDDAFTQRFTESIRIGEASDTESERLSEGDQSQTNGAQTGNKSPFNPTRDLPLLSWRKNGRGKVVSRVLDIRIPSHPVCKHQSEAAKVELIQQIEDIFPRITPPNDYADVRQGLLSRLRKIIADEWPGAGIDVYGSAGNGLGLRSADVDMSLYMPKSVAAALGREKGRPHPPKLILERLATLMEENDMIILNQLLDARVPVIKMQDPVSKLQVDVCINNILAVKNTQLLKAYVDLDERFRYVCILVKLWAKRRELNDAYTGTLSSYAYTLLVIHYLQTLQPPVLPCLQLMVGGERVTAITKLPKEMTDNGAGTLYNTYYDHSVTAETFKPENTMPVHELLLGFFRYFAYTFKYKTDLASIRLGARKPRSARAWDEKSIYGEWESKQAKYRTDLGIAKASLDARRKAEVKEQKLQEDGGVKANSGKGSGAGTAKKERVQFPKRPRLISKHLFCIEDPFDIDHDLSRGMEKAAVTVIRQEMMRAYEIIAESGDFEMACEEFR